jgi:hypothetical protein
MKPTNNPDSSSWIPDVGTPATIVIGSDRYPATVIRTTSKGTVWVQEDDAVCESKNAHNSEMQFWTYQRNPNGRVLRCRPRKNRIPWTSGGTPVYMGFRNRYNDPCF